MKQYCEPLSRFEPALSAVYRAYHEIFACLTEAGGQLPDIFGGIGVLALCQPAHFRPAAKHLSRDLDLLLAAQELPLWERLFSCTFRYEDSETFAGWTAESHVGDIHIDLLVEAEFRFPQLTPAMVFSFDRCGLAAVSAVVGGAPARVPAPAAQLAFKLLLGRLPAQGKHDYADAAALMIDGQVSAESLHQALARQNVPPFSALIASRLATCEELSSHQAVRAFCRAYRQRYDDEQGRSR